MGRSRWWKQKDSRVLFCSYILLMRRRGQPQRASDSATVGVAVLLGTRTPSCARDVICRCIHTLSFQPEVADSTTLSITPPQKL